MNTERLLAHYERIADASDAVQRLRRLVLDLAVRGKLLPQDPANELLAKTYLREPSSKSLPSNWRVLNFEKYCDIQGGNQPPKSQFVDEPRDGYVQLFQIRDLGERPVPTYIPINSTNRFCKEGEILIGRYGASVGKVFWAQNGAYNVAMAKFIWPEDAFISTFAFLLLKSRYFQEPLESATRSAQAGFNKGDLAAINFPLPPLAEQHRIVAKVDELMALCDRLEAARAEREATRDRLAESTLARLNTPDPATFQADARFALDTIPALTFRPDQIKQLRQTILNLAVRGKLVPQDPKDEPAVALLKRITKEISTYAKANRIGPVQADPISDDDLPFYAPPGWQWSRLCNLFNVITDGDHQPPPKADAGVAFLTIGNITTGRLDFAGCRLVPESYFKALAPYRIPLKGDILYTVVGATYGRPALVETDRAFCIQRHIAILRPAEAMSLRYLFTLLASPLIYDQATRSTTGTAQPTIGLRPLRNFLAPIPPLAEQRRIVAKVDALMKICDQLEASLDQTATTRRRLLDALLAEALVPVSTLSRDEAA